MLGSSDWFVRTADGNVYGPADGPTLVRWAEDGRIEPTSFLSQDRISWTPAQKMAVLGMDWLVEVAPGKVFGPFNRAVVIRLFADRTVPDGAQAYRRWSLPADQDPPPVVVEKEIRIEVPVEKIVERIVEKEVRVEVPVEKIVEKIVEVLPPVRTATSVPAVVKPAGTLSPRRGLGSLFAGVDRNRLAALEAAARRELATARGRGFGFVGGIFGRKRS